MALRLGFWSVAVCRWPSPSTRERSRELYMCSLSPRVPKTVQETIAGERLLRFHVRAASLKWPWLRFFSRMVVESGALC